ncbi:MAG: VWA domain-containing protein, partial [Ferruginibacter sp.]
MLGFQHIEYLLALAAVPLMILLYFVVVNWKKRTIKKIGDPVLVNELIKNYSPQKFAIKFILITVAFTCCGFALANLRQPSGSEKITRNGIDVMIALDVSKSMLAQDVKPSRLDRAKQLLSKLVDKLTNDRIGIVVFAGRAYMQMPLTADHSAAKMYIGSCSPDMVQTQGTVIGDALKSCYTSFSSREKKYKSVVLISDGEDHDEEAGKIAAQMADEGVTINTVGVGSPEGSVIMDPLTNELKKDKDGNTVISKLNENELKKIAENGNGIYQLLSNTDNVVAKLDEQFNTMDQRTVTEDSLVSYQSFFEWFLAAALALLVADMFFSEKKKEEQFKTSMAINKPFALVIFFICCSACSFAQQENKLIKKGNDAYDKSDYVTATDAYKKVTDKNATNATAQYNLGNALYKSSKSDDAIQAYDNAIESAATQADKAQAYYNKGVVLQNNKKIPECIGAYKNALKLNPSDQDARLNLQKALFQQKQQQKQQQQQQKDK